jgi:hypothetical protein
LRYGRSSILIARRSSIVWFDFFNGYRNRLLSVIENIHHVIGDSFGEPMLLLF